MENATQALLIAAGILIAIMVVTLLILGWNSISSYFQAENEKTEIMQLTEFNKQFENYAHDNLRGSDLLSLINKVNDYNERKVEVEDQGYRKMEITINIGSSNLSKFRFISDEAKLITTATITQENISTISEAVVELENKYGSVAEASKLSANIHNFLNVKNQTNEEAIDILNRLLVKSVSDYGGLAQVREDAQTYYEITQFKRARFDCKSTEYDENTGRIIKMTFEFNGKFQ